MRSKSKSLVLLSGGIDSYVALALEKRRGSDCSSLSFRYDGQSLLEVKAIQEISKRENVPNYMIKHPKIIGKMYAGKPVQFSPDNLLYYSIAICFARNNNLSRIVGGQNKDDLIHAPDADAIFYRSLNGVLEESYSNIDIKIIQPLLNMTKMEVVKKAQEKGIVFQNLNIKRFLEEKKENKNKNGLK